MFVQSSKPDPDAMDESGRTARPSRNKPGKRTFDARREQIVGKAPVSRKITSVQGGFAANASPIWPMKFRKN